MIVPQARKNPPDLAYIELSANEKHFLSPAV